MEKPTQYTKKLNRNEVLGTETETPLTLCQACHTSTKSNPKMPWRHSGSASISVFRISEASRCPASSIMIRRTTRDTSHRVSISPSQGGTRGFICSLVALNTSQGNVAPNTPSADRSQLDQHIAKCPFRVRWAALVSLDAPWKSSRPFWSAPALAHILRASQHFTIAYTMQNQSSNSRHNTPKPA